MVLLRMGFTYALYVTIQAVVSYTALPPLPHKCGGIFLLHYPWSHLHRTLSGILPCEARTFLTCTAILPWQPRSSVLLVNITIDIFNEFIPLVLIFYIVFWTQFSCYIIMSYNIFCFDIKLNTKPCS